MQYPTDCTAPSKRYSFALRLFPGYWAFGVNIAEVMNYSISVLRSTITSPGA